MMNSWKQFLDTLNTPGGHIMLLSMTVAGMTLANSYGVPKADDMAVGAFGAFLAILSGKIPNVTSQRVETMVETEHEGDSKSIEPKKEI